MSIRFAGPLSFTVNEMFRWLAGRGASRGRVARELSMISSQAWRHAVLRLPFLMGLSWQQDEALRKRVAWLLASKTFSGARGLEVTGDIRLAIAIQAALPIMELSPTLYEGWIEIIVYPGGFLIPRSEVHEGGVVAEYMLAASGEAWDGGPVILSWEDSHPGQTHSTNVVIHEFAHKLDLYGGIADGMPSLHAHPNIRAATWMRVMDAAFKRFSHLLDDIEREIPGHIDPESEAASPWYDKLPLDPYAATDVAEFFAVSSEGFFVNPAPLAEVLPDWYGLLRQYYRQDPLSRLHP